jgi:acyl carrier protein
MTMAKLEQLNNIEVWLIDWFATRSKNTKKVAQHGLAPETDYFEASLLTSMEVVEFVTEIEGKFGIQFSDQDLQDRRFVTIAGLAELILESSAATSESRQT